MFWQTAVLPDEPPVLPPEPPPDDEELLDDPEPPDPASVEPVAPVDPVPPLVEPPCDEALPLVEGLPLDDDPASTPESDAASSPLQAATAKEPATAMPRSARRIRRMLHRFP
jgi:hypothetical protein